MPAHELQTATRCVAPAPAAKIEQIEQRWVQIYGLQIVHVINYCSEISTGRICYIQITIDKLGDVNTSLSRVLD